MVALESPVDAGDSEPATAIVESFIADHDRLEVLYERVLRALNAKDREDALRGWPEFESALVAHMDTEEAYLIPALHRIRPTAARIVVQEHRHIRARLAEVGAAIDDGKLTIPTARAFLDELCAHARSEERLLYRWADGRLDAAEKVTILQSLANAPTSRASH